MMDHPFVADQSNERLSNDNGSTKEKEPMYPLLLKERGRLHKDASRAYVT
jgi:hypothetical protein